MFVVGLAIALFGAPGCKSEREQAREKVQEEQQQARGAGERVGEEKQDMTEARRKAMEEKAQAAQAREREHLQAPAATAEGEQSATGKITEIRDGSIVLEVAGKAPLVLFLDEKTAIVLDDQRVGVAQLQRGAEVKADYKMVEDRPTATHIEDTGRQPVGGQE
jgi:hypothetical protein